MSSTWVRPNKSSGYSVGYRLGTKCSTLRLGTGIPKKVAEKIAAELNLLIQHLENGLEPAAETKRWLEEMGDERYAQLVEQGLVSNKRRRVGFLAHVEDFFTRRALNNNAPASTQAVWGRAIKWSKAFWPEDIPIQSLTGQMAADFRGFLLTQRGKGNATWSEASANKICGVISQALNAAVKEGLIDRNPLRGWVKTTAGANPSTWEYIEVETIRLVIAASKCPEERLLVGLSRFAALRIPSEIKSLKWADLRRVGDVAVLKVHTPKTGKTGKHFKSVPVCRELLALMDEARRATTSEFMLPQLRHHTNPQMVFRRLCDKAGVRRWKKQTHQLRASCLSDWMRQYSPIEVSQWAGNSPKVLLTHYPRSEKGDDLILAAARNFSGTGQPPAPSALAGAASVTAPVTASCEKVAA